MVVPYANYEYESDCMHLRKWEKFNKGFSYCMLFIDIFSRYVWGFKLKTLKAQESLNIFELFFKDNYCEVLKTDAGGEYINRKVESFLSDKKIKHIISRNSTKANFAERVIKTIKFKLIKNMYYEQSYNWVDYLESALYSYNNSEHRSIKMTPSQALVADPSVVWANQYLPRNKNKKKDFKSVQNQTPFSVPVESRSENVNIVSPEKSAFSPHIRNKEAKLAELSELKTTPAQTFVESSSSAQKLPLQNNIDFEKVLNTQKRVQDIKSSGGSDSFSVHVPEFTGSPEPKRRRRNLMAGGGGALKARKKQKLMKFRYNIGDTVRIARLFHAFKRAYDENWTQELFTVVGRSLQQGFPKYTLRSWANDLIDGDFYEPEIQRVFVDNDTVFKIDRVIRSQKKNGIPGKIVSWLGWPLVYASWVSNDDFRSIKQRKA